ncbi:MAG: DNA recombination/repair protein RecA, partial [Sulfurimonas sp.]
PPFRLAEFDIMFGEGISKEGELVDYGVKLDIIDKAGAWFAYEETKLGQGRENVKQKFKDEPELAKEIEEKIKVAMGISNVMVMETAEINDSDV